MNARLTLLGLLALATGCFNLPDETEVGRFACSADADCLDGYRCLSGKCAGSSSSDAVSPPTEVTLSGSGLQVSIGWRNPAGVAGVQVVRKIGTLPPGPTDGTVIYDGVGTTTLDDLLTAGTTYCYSLYAYNAARSFSTAAPAGCYLANTSSPTAPSTVTGFTATAGTRAATLQWTFPTTAYSGVAVRRAVGTAPATVSDGTEVFRGTAASFLDSSLTPNTTYCYSAFVFNAASLYSTAATACATPTAPVAVTGLSLTPGDGQLQIAWTNPSDPGFNGVEVRRTTGTAATSPTDGVQAYHGTGATFLDTGLTNGTSYCYAVFELDKGGTYAAPASACATPTPVSTVQALAATPGDRTVTLTWIVPGGVTSVEVRRAPDVAPATPTAGTRVHQALDTTYVDSSLTNGSVYCYSVFATNALGSVSPPASVCAQPRQVTAQASWAPQWNDWASNSGSVACDANTASTQQRACYHGGQTRMIPLPASITSCAGISASDQLGVFVWYCNADQLPVQIRSKVFQPGKSLIDLIDRSIPAWRKNQVTVMSGSTLVLATNPEVWWDNPVKAANAGDTLTGGTIYVLSPAAADIVVPRGAAIIPAAGATAFTGSSNAAVAVIDVESSFTWVEGFDLRPTSSSKIPLLYNNATVGVARSLSVTGGLGIILSSSAGLRLRDIESTGSYRALELQSSPYNIVETLVGANPGFAGLGMTSSVGNIFVDVRAFNSAMHGIQLLDSSANVFNTVTMANNFGIGLTIQADSTSMAATNVFSNITSMNNSVGVSVTGAGAGRNAFFNLVAQSVSLDGSSSTTISDAWLGSVTLNNTSFNTFTGSIVAPSAGFCVLSGTNTSPGLDTSCASTTPTATMVVGPTMTVGASFKRNVASDTHQTAGTLDYALVTSWTQFDNAFRVWGRDFTSSGYTSWPAAGQTLNCGTGQLCQVWDFSLATGDATLLGRGTKTSSYTHIWSNYGTAAACAAMPTAVWTGTACTSTFNPDGIERGTTDGLCETGDSCIRAVNLGAYQGSGTLVYDSSTGNITYSKWSVNGEPP